MRFHILGPLRVIGPDGAPARLEPRHARLLAALLLNPNQTVARPELIDAAWDAAPPTAGRQVQNLISALRQRVGREIVADGPGYRIDVAPDQLDSLVFADQIGRAGTLIADGQPADAAGYLRAALRLWRGPALAGLAGRTIEAAAAGLQEQRLTALEQCLELELAAGQHHELVSELAELATAHPLREGLVGHFMIALCRSGRQADALGAYRKLKAHLADELGIDPGPALRDLYASILRQERRTNPTLMEGATGAAPARRPPPPHRPFVGRSAELDRGRRDNARTVVAPPADAAERLWLPGLPTPADRPLVAQLPAPVADFVDRAQLDVLRSLAPSGELPAGVTVVVVTGGGGVGKTTLAVRWAHELRQRYPAGQFYIDLRGFSTERPLSPSKALSCFLHALGVGLDRVPTEVAEAAALYRSLVAAQPVLVVLDSAASTDQVLPLLPSAAGSLVVVTSRKRLSGLVVQYGARRVEVGQLTPAESMTLFGRMIGASRLAAEPEAAAQVTSACAHLALAVRIAAANLLDRPDRHLAGYAAELASAGALDALENDDVAIRRTFAHSYGGLESDARQVFRRLSLVVGPTVGRPAAHAVAGLPEPALTVALDRLTAAHLIEREGADRYRFHDLLRLYARERLDADDPNRLAAHDALLAWYVGHVRAAAAVLYPFKPQLDDLADPRWSEVSFADRQAALDWLDAEAPNLVAAVRDYAERGLRQPVWLLAYTLRGYFDLRGETADWLALADLALCAARDDGAPQAYAAAEHNLAHVLLFTGKRPEAITHGHRFLEASRRSGWLKGEALAGATLGVTYLDNGQVDTAVSHLRSCLRLARQSGEMVLEANALENLGIAHLQLGELVEAGRQIRLALARYRQHGDCFSGEAHALTLLAELDRALDQPHDALGRCAQALDIYRKAGNLVGEAYARYTAASACPERGDLDAAAGEARQAVDLAERAGDLVYASEANSILAELHLRAGRADSAHQAFTRALASARAASAPYQTATALIGLAVAATDLEPDSPADARHLDEAARIAAHCRFRVIAADVLVARARLRGPLPDADCLRQALEIYHAAGHRRGERRTRNLLPTDPASKAQDFLL
jgi:DNA-binding SARP family transcriptional activator